MTHRLFIFALLYCFLGFPLAGQELRFTDFMQQVKTAHPAAIQANLQTAKGQAALQRARGGFDPVLALDLNQKQYEGSAYYRLFDGSLRVPTPIGIDVTGGYETNGGIYLNAENTTPASGLGYLGVSVPLGQGLFNDSRRTALAQARVFNERTTVERQLMMNDLLYAAGSAYWQWFAAYHSVGVYREATELAEDRAAGILRSAEMGDLPAIDTVEAAIQVQNRRLALQSTQLDLANQSARLAVFLWEDNAQVQLETDNSTPMDFEQVFIQGGSQGNFLDDSLRTNHPRLLKFRYEQQKVELERDLLREMVKPRVNLKYQTLFQPFENGGGETISVHNYTWGLQVRMPLWQRAGRGNLKLGEIKLQEIQLEMVNTRADIDFEIQTAWNHLQTLNTQMELQTQVVKDNASLLDAERRLFEIGESSLFLLNSREVNYINARIKLISLTSHREQARLRLDYALGLLN